MTDSTESGSAASQPRPPSVAQRGRYLAAGVWCGLLLGAFLAGWAGARAARSQAEVAGPAAPAADGAVGPSKVDRSPAASPASLSLVSLPQIQDQLDAIGAQLDDPKLDGTANGGRLVSPSDEVVPESQRWQINFASGVTEPEYARQLAALGVELGVVRDDGTIEYLANPGKADPQRRVGPRAEEKRLYWTWSRGNLDKADKSLLKNAGIDAGDDLVLHLWPPATSDNLAALERDYKGRQSKQIYRTRFAIKRTFRGYEVYVEEQVTR